MATDSKLNGEKIDDSNALQSICYKRGSLQLLDQRKLPLETVYLDIQNASDGWFAIRDMVVRGAPAIAIAAALSLAVEAFNLNAFDGTPDDAASFLVQKLEYLVSSRPTAVNLSDAVAKLKLVISKAASRSSEAKAVFKAYIEAAEIMLEEDVASNKAIGSYGANCFQSQLKDDKKMSILTHCNTGSLATAGYGTALGVIRALHVQGLLERAYCTETRPFNQGSRLTAFELVHEKIPATLIADSAAAALMKAGRVQGVIVGADRVAANGDTANKIGTFSLALCARHHNIPFYVAAPITSIDLSLPSGEDIVIEERSPKELLNTRGGLGEQIAASGISVWNPAFDVTPASLIAGIITEKGVISKTQDDAYHVKDFVQKVANVELDEALSQCAYMLLYSRISPHTTCLKTFRSARQQLHETDERVSPRSIRNSCSSTHAHVLSDTEQLDNTDNTQKGRLSRVEPESVEVSTEDFSISVEANEDDASEELTTGSDHTHGHVPNSPNCPSETSYNVSASPLLSGGIKTSQNVTVNGFPESHGKLEEHMFKIEPHLAGNSFSDVKRDRKYVAYIDEAAHVQFGPKLNANEFVDCPQLKSDNFEIHIDDMDRDDVEVSVK